jgi:hypothetical protein
MLTAFPWIAASIVINGVDITNASFFILLAVGAFIVVPLAFFRKWYFYRRRLKKQPITAEYEPPLDLNPAEIGYLFDGKLREREVAGTIIHLIQRGLLHVKKTEKGKRIFAGPRVDDNLKTYETKLIEEADVDGGVESKQLLRRFTYIKTEQVGMVAASKSFLFTQLVHSDLQRRQYVKNNSTKAFFSVTLKIALALQIILVILPAIGLWILITLHEGTANIESLGLFLLISVTFCIVSIIPFMVVSMILNILRGRIIGREWIVTKKLERMWPQIVGYRQYVQLVESEKLEFQTSQIKKVSKNETLPYAVALGFVKNWRDLLS